MSWIVDNKDKLGGWAVAVFPTLMFVLGVLFGFFARSMAGG